MRPAISIDFGAAYTKIALRKEPNSTATLLSHEKLRLDEGHVCIPTIAAWREADDRWIFGGDAADIQPGEGIHVFRNWKPVLFTPPGEVLDPQSSIGRLFYYNLEGGSGDKWPPIKKLAVKYFDWLLNVMFPALMDFSDLNDPVLRISIPDFTEESYYAFQLQEVILEAGWDSPYVFCEPEPMTNIFGALSQGKNAMMADESGTVCPDVNEIFSGSGVVNYIKRASSAENASGFTMLLIDIGAYTTDFAMISIDGGSEGSLPPSEALSVPYGIELLDNLVKHGLSVEKSAVVDKLSATDREIFRRTVYSEDRSWSINDITIGDPGDRVVLEKCINGMATRIANEIDKFMTQFGVEKVNEVVLTGGGSNIPRMTQKLAERLAAKGVDTIHSASTPKVEARTVQLTQQVVRGSSAIGGASVLFGDE